MVQGGRKPLSGEYGKTVEEKVKESPGVLHLDLGRGWRGGQRQAFHLHRGMVNRGLESLFLCLNGSPLEERLRDESLPYGSFRVYGELDALSGARLAERALRTGSAIIHAHCAHALSTALWAKVFSPGLRVVASRRVDFPVGGNPFSRLKYRSALLDAVICVSNAVKDVMVECGVPAEKLFTVHSGADPERFRGVEPDEGFRNRLNIPRDHAVVGTIAALVGHKDYSNLLQAASSVLKRNRRVTFLALGEGEMESDLRSLASELGLGNSFRFLGFMPDPLEYLVNFDVFVLASRKEGLGTSVLDAMNLSIPVVGTDAGGIPEMIRNEVNGLLVPREDHEALASAILRLADDRELRNILGKGGLRTAEEFTVDSMVNGTTAIYRKLLHEG